MFNLQELLAAAVAAEASKASTSTKRIKRAKYEPIRGALKSDIWAPAMDGRACIKVFDWDDMACKLRGTDQQVDTFVAEDAKDGKSYRYLVIKRLEQWVDETGAKVRKLRKHVARMSRVSEDNPDFLEGSCRDYYITNLDGSRNHYGCVNRMTWEYLPCGRVEISYQRLEDPILGGNGVYFVVSMEMYEDARGVLRVRYNKLNDARKESSEVLFFDTQEEQLGWEEWYRQGCAGAGSMIEWDVHPITVLYAPYRDRWDEVLRDYEANQKADYAPDISEEVSELMKLLGV